ncbi:hypothetical protein ACQEVC_45295 [Plantactinospora sp. CA-294935]|uniref:hypothetical protein n=1 Tax=Plantactinospora sp. CA-294935 TaxID=3240012 RepID=UPI003D91B582
MTIPSRQNHRATLTVRDTLILIASAVLTIRVAHYGGLITLTAAADLTTFIVGPPATAAAILAFDRLRILRQRNRADAAERECQAAQEEAAKATAEADLLRRHRDRFDQRRQAEMQAAREAEERSWWEDDASPDDDTVVFGSDVIPLILRRQRESKESA